MNTLSYKTKSAKNTDVKRNWYIVDATDMIVGRLSTKVATILRGKHKAQFTPHVDCGDFVIIINADKVRFTGKKMTEKGYFSYSGYPGGQKKRTPAQLLKYKPIQVIEHSIKGMLPKNKLGSAMFRKLFAYAGGEHPHAAQKPEKLEV